MRIKKLHTILFLLFFIFIAGLFQSCNEEITPNPDNKTEEEQVSRIEYYMTVGIALPYALDEDDKFYYGVEAETALMPSDELHPHHFMILYDENGKVMDISLLTNAQFVDNNERSTNYSVMLARVVGKPIDLAEGYFLQLKHCLVILNTDFTEDELHSDSLEDILKKIVNKSWIEMDGRKYFTMTNSVYVENGMKNYSSEVKYNSENYKEYFYENQMDAMLAALEGKAAFDVYVERMAAKFQLFFSEQLTKENNEEYVFIPTSNSLSIFKEIDSKTNAPSYDHGNSFRVRITGWGMNAIEKESHFFKNISEEGQYFTDWNDIDNKRSYWAEDPDYNYLIYPLQYRKAVDKDQYNYETLEANYQNKLKNYSYDEIVKQNNFNNYVYTPENTYNSKLKSLQEILGERIDILAGTHLLITAELLTDLDKKGVYEARDVYRDRTGNFYRNQKDCFIAMVTEFNHALKSQSRMNFIPYDWENPDNHNEGDVLEMSTQGEYILCYQGNPLTLEYMQGMNLNNYIMDASVDGGDGKCIIWLPDLTIQKMVNGEVTQTHMGVLESSENDKEYGNEKHTIRKEPVNENELKSFMYEWMGALEHFTDGKMYYSVPVMHNSLTGLHGVVRNHSYSFLLESISKVGTSVDNSRQPIVPRVLENNNRIELKTEILDWHSFESSFTPSGF